MSKLSDIIQNSNNIVFFGGAGVSTESGIPDFRSKDGLYNNTEYEYSPERMLSRPFFKYHTQEFFEFYRDKICLLGYKPNELHYKLAKLESIGKLKAVVTQNIDGLHQMAGSKNVIELHGSIYKNYCTKCKKEYSAEYIKKSTGVPRCIECNLRGIIKPNVVLYEESLPSKAINEAFDVISKADTLIIGGTSLSVYPAASLVDGFTGKNLVIINKGEVERKNIFADLVIDDSLVEAFKDVIVE